jgi:sortase A
VKRHLTTVLLVAVFLVGLSVLLYPTVSDYINTLTQSRVINQYAGDMAKINAADYTKLLEDARAYNDTLAAHPNRFMPTESETAAYNALLDIGGSGVMGYLEIPAIGGKFAIYHGTSEAVLQVGIGHLEGSSLPVGGVGTHAALSGHRGLPSAMLLSDLDKMVLGDHFIMTILDETLTYEVDLILDMVEPDDMSSLVIDPNKDVVTLITCTPYGINSHRLLVRGVRVENAEGAAAPLRVPADGQLVDAIQVAPILAVPILLLLMLYMLLKYRIHKEGK